MWRKNHQFEVISYLSPLAEEEGENPHISDYGMRVNHSSTAQTTSTGGSILVSLSHHDDNRSFRVESKFDQEEEEEEEVTDRGQVQGKWELFILWCRKKKITLT